MDRKQRYRYEMLVRVRDFGAAHRELFPESSKGGRLFGQVGAAVAAVEDHLTRRDRARVEARRVKATTRAAVTRYMAAIARTARRVTAGEPALNTFRLAGSQTAAAVLSRARLFIEEARPREAAFVEFGLPPAFISDFTALVNQLDDAVAVRNNGRGWRLSAQRGIEGALRSGADALVNLDVLVPNTIGGHPAIEGHWRGARRIEGQGSSSSRAVKTPVVAPAVVSPDVTTVEPPASDAANPPAVEAPAIAEPVAFVHVIDDPLRRAS